MTARSPLRAVNGFPFRSSSEPQTQKPAGGLLLVAAFADRWGTDPYPPGGKTVWAEVAVPSA
jgi:hypothetical protein